jgi:ankyrin repeat protein
MEHLKKFENLFNPARNNYEVVKLLVEAGADLTIADKEGKTIFDWCIPNSKIQKWFKENFDEFFSAKKYNL